MPNHEHHDHKHGTGCGHTAIEHEGHVDFLHDGHLHHPTTGGVIEEHTLPVTAVNPDECTSGHSCGAHADDHQHGPNCGHEAVPHGDHIDYLVDGHLHHPHDGHCDNHGTIKVVS